MTKAEQLLARIQETKADVLALQTLWSEVVAGQPEMQPSKNQFMVWLKLYDFDIVAAAIDTLVYHLGEMEEKGISPNLSGIIKYVSGIMANMKNPERSKRKRAESQVIKQEAEQDSHEVDAFNIEDEDE